MPSRSIITAARHVSRYTTQGCEHRAKVALLASALMFLLAVPCFRASADHVERLEKRVREWIALRQQIGESEAAWKEQKMLLDDEQTMLLQQKQHLDGRLRQAQAEEQSAREKLIGVERDHEAVETALQDLGVPLRNAEQHLKTWPERLPEFMLEPLRHAFARIPRNEQERDAVPLSERLQLVFGLYSQIEQLNRSIHAGKMVLTEPGGRQLEMDTLFLGLALGYAVSPDGAKSAMAVPGAKGWTWTWQPELAPAIANALASYRKDRPADFVRVPMTIGATDE